MFFRQLTGREPKRSDTLLSHRYACYNTYETADGRYLSIGAVENRFWRKLCEILGVPEYSALQYDDERRLEIMDRLRRIFKSKTLAEWEAVLGDADICWGRVQSLSEVLDAPLFREREMVVEIEGRDGRMSKTLGVPVKLSDTPGAVRTPPVEFGESTAAILRELGYDKNTIREFSEQGVV